MYYSSGSIEIDAIDVSNLRRYCSRRNRIGSNRTNVTKAAVQWEFEYTFFASTLNPMGKRRCLEIEDYAGDTTGNTRRRMRQSEMVRSNKKAPSLSKPRFAIWSYSLRAYCRLPREINLKHSDRSMEFIRFLHIQMASWRRNEAKTLRWDPCDRVLGRFDI